MGRLRKPTDTNPPLWCYQRYGSSRSHVLGYFSWWYQGAVLRRRSISAYFTFQDLFELINYGESTTLFKDKAQKPDSLKNFLKLINRKVLNLMVVETQTQKSVQIFELVQDNPIIVRSLAKNKRIVAEIKVSFLLEFGLFWSKRYLAISALSVVSINTFHSVWDWSSDSSLKD